MRVHATSGDLSVTAIAGTNVILLAFDLPYAKCKGLLGFSIERSINGAPFQPLSGSRIFSYAYFEFKPHAPTPSTRFPIQEFVWPDFTAEPDSRYTFRVTALRGESRTPTPTDSVEFAITTENPAAGMHNIYCNRGAAGTQQYLREFGKKSPIAIGPAAYTWLSRGLDDAILNFIAQANGPSFGLRVAAYDFTWPPLLKALAAARRAKAGVQVLYHARERDSEKDGKLTQTGRNRRAVARARLKGICHERRAPLADRNNFIVFLKDGEPVSVLTASSDFTEAGIFAHSSIAHVVHDKAVAAAYLAYWDSPACDPPARRLPEKGVTVVFSAAGLAERLARQAKQALFLNFAFGMPPSFQRIYATSRAPLRYALLEKSALPRRDKTLEEADRQQLYALRRRKGNEFAICASIAYNPFESWLRKSSSPWLHPKFLLIDPLSDDPIVVTGSGNVRDGDMLIIRGDTRVADIYLGEYMRLHRHYSYREWVAWHPDERKDPSHEYLADDNFWWRPFLKDTPHGRRKAYFSQTR